MFLILILTLVVLRHCQTCFVTVISPISNCCSLTFTMTTKIQPPSYKSCSSYDHYKVLVEAWSTVTDVAKNKQGIVIALSLEGNDESKICEKIFTSLKLDDLKKETGLATLLTFLDKELGKDDLEDVVARYDDFEDCRKQHGESMNQYISNFEQKVSRIRAKNIKLPSVVLGFKLMRGACLSKEEKILVLSGINYEEQESLYEQAQKSLKKFKGEGSSVGSYSSGASHNATAPAIKVEPTYYTRGGLAYRGSGSGFRSRPWSSWKGNYGGRGIRQPTPTHESWRGPRPTGYGNNSWRGTKTLESWRPSGYQRGNASWQDRGNISKQVSWRDGYSGEKKANPLGLDGQPLACASCRSIQHFVKDCPDSWENLKSVNIVDDQNQQNQQEVYECDNYTGTFGGEEYEDYYTHFPCGSEYVEEPSAEHVVLFTGYNKPDVLQLEVEAHNCAVLDCACTSTVCGRAWLEDYLASLDPADRHSVLKKDGHRIFKFGGGVRLKSDAEYALPAFLAGCSVLIHTDVVESDIPLLLSKTAMKKAGVILNTVNDSATILGKVVSLNCTSSGHYCVPIVKNEDVSVLVVDLEKFPPHDKLSALVKLHRQMGHPTEAKLVALLKDANCWSDEYMQLMNKVYDRCDRCKEFARTPPRPVVSLPMASKFNEVIAMDLKAWGSRWILHLIDMFSRYSISVFVSRKTKETIIDNIITQWIAYFGVMKKVLSDNGGEFRNDEMREVCSILEVEVLTTAAESPFQNGLCERNHAVVDMILHKLTADFPHVRPEVLLRWANMTKNTLQMWNGYSSNQLVFGINPNLPNIFGASLPALEDSTMSRTLAEHLNILHASRKAFVETEASERIRRALRSRIRASEEIYSNGDRVYYKRDHSLRWLGPAKVVFQDRKVVFLDHGGYYIKVSPNRLLKAPCQFVKSGDQTVVPTLSDQENDNPVVDGPLLLDDNDISVVRNGDVAQDQHGDTDLNNTTQSDQVEQQPEVLLDNTDMGASIGHGGDDTAIVRKSLRVFNKEHGCQVYMVTIPRGRHDDADCTLAKQTELQKLQAFNVYEEVPDHNGRQCISTRWVLWQKGKEVRARLVARGFEEDTSRTAIDSPTVGKFTVRAVLAVAASKHWVVKCTDIKSAFLQGKDLQRDVFITPPKEADVPDGFVWKLNRCLYGLNDAARQFYDSVVDELVSLGCFKSDLDPSLFFKTSSDGLSGLMVSHIDDFLHAGDNAFDIGITKKLCQRFLAGRNQAGEFKYVGYQITQGIYGIILDQNCYVESVEPVLMAAERELKKSSCLDRTEAKQYRSLVGSLNWIVQGTRPDLAFQLVDLSTKFKSGTVEDLIKVRKLLIKAKDSKAEIMFPDLGSVHHWRIIIYTDASLNNLCEGISSCVGYIVFLVGQYNRSCPLTWKSGKARRVVTSTIGAEAMALLAGLDEALYLKTILLQVLSLQAKSLPIIAYIDHQGLWESLRSTKLVEDRRLRVEIAGIKQSLQREEVKDVRLCSSAEQLADCLTKKGVDGRKLLSVLQRGSLDLQM